MSLLNMLAGLGLLRRTVVQEPGENVLKRRREAEAEIKREKHRRISLRGGGRQEIERRRRQMGKA